MKIRTVGWIPVAQLLIATHSPATTKNIILHIGDGMGASQLTAARYAKGELEVERKICFVVQYITQKWRRR